MSDSSRSTTGLAVKGSETKASPPEIDARNLARIAEWVDGLRDENLVVVRENGGWTVRAEQPGDADKAVLKSRKPLNVPKERRRMESEVTIRGHPLKENYDALFWTESAIEKFLFPYYASHRIMTDEEHKDLMAAYQKDSLVAIAHVAPSQGIPLLSDGLGGVRVIVSRDVRGVDGGITPLLVDMSVREFLAQGS
ncbi:MAG: hypothetical protein H0T44_10165 [Gemmatimonadales bacterium]|nr:hypothetical protein [Gemmatimonadales bacterium]MDQ3427737.1 hypothetical protein [Gemmatimonadota bacterium]